MNHKLTKRVSAAREEGFTLIELLIVIVILGILAGIVSFGVAQFRDDSTAAACESDKKNVQTAVTAYRAKNPTGTASIGTTASPGNLITGGYLKSVPKTAVTISGDDVTGPAC